MSDLISRQSAIDALIRKRQPVDNGDGTMTITLMSDRVIKETLEKLPSAQPEIIRCKDCKWHNREINQCSVQICASMRGEDFCSRAERRTDEAD